VRIALARWRREIPLPPRGDVWALAGLAAFVVFLFQDVLLRGRVLYERDIHSIWHGQVESFVRCIASGSWPLWDPYLSFGQPMLANPGTQVLYPWTWLNLLAPPALVYTLYVVGHLMLAGIGMYLLARRLEQSRSASFIAASIWTGSGPLLSMVSLWHHFAGAAWMPWVVLAADAVLRSPGVGRALLWGAAFAGQILAGSADMCAMTAAVTAIHALPLLRRRDSPRAPLRALGSAAVALAFALGLSAALWIPVLETARRSGRWDMAEGMRTVWSVHPANLLQMVLPVLPSDLPLTSPARRTLFDVADPFLGSLYVGLPALALAAAAFAGSRRPWLFGLIALGALLLALGRHTRAYALAVHLVPPLRILRYPSKAMVPAVFAGAVLCAYGFEAWRRREAGGRRAWSLVVAAPTVAGALLTWSAVYVLVHPEAWSRGQLEARPGQSLEEALAPAVRKLVVAGVMATIVASLAVARAVRPQTARASALAVSVLAAGGLLWAHLDLNPTAPGDFYRLRPPILDVLRNEGARRIYVFDYIRASGRAYRGPAGSNMFTAASPLAAAYGLQAYLMPITGSRWGLFGSYETDIYGLYPPPLKSLTLVLRASEEMPLHDRLLKIGAVDHVVALHEEGLESLERIATLPSPFAAPIRVFRVPGAWPRSYVVPGTRIADGVETYRVLADPSFDPAREVVLPSGGEGPSGGGLAAGGPAGLSRIVELRHDRVRLEAELQQPGHLVLADTYDPGWKATVDGRRADVRRANGAFRAVRLDAGRHVVEMAYRPASVVAGALVSVVAALLGGAVVAARAVGGAA
jgi:hypothetical protein